MYGQGLVKNVPLMSVPLFCRVLQGTLSPFMKEKFPSPSIHQLIQDNDPKHCLQRE